LLSKDDIGYLFPDTYSFSPSVTPEQVIEALKRNFENKTKRLEQDFLKSTRKKEDLVIMASIIEKEASGENDAPVISGILWKRLDRGIALQVDAPFLFLLGKKSSELTIKDLAIKSPYNTYINKGLPPTPISNPGLSAIEAALKPVDSPYFYYLHGNDGIVRYAKTFDEHKANIQKYLK